MLPRHTGVKNRRTPFSFSFTPFTTAYDATIHGEGGGGMAVIIVAFFLSASRGDTGKMEAFLLAAVTSFSFSFPQGPPTSFTVVTGEESEVGGPCGKTKKGKGGEGVQWEGSASDGGNEGDTREDEEGGGGRGGGSGIKERR